MKHSTFLNTYFGGEPVKSRHVTRFIQDALKNTYTAEKAYRALVHYPGYPYKIRPRRRILSTSMTIEGAACGAYSMFAFRHADINFNLAQIHVFEIEKPTVLMDYDQIERFARHPDSTLSIDIIDGEQEMLILAKPFSHLVKVFHMSDPENSFIISHAE